MAALTWARWLGRLPARRRAPGARAAAFRLSPGAPASPTSVASGSESSSTTGGGTPLSCAAPPGVVLRDLPDLDLPLPISMLWPKGSASPLIARFVELVESRLAEAA